MADWLRLRKDPNPEEKHVLVGNHSLVTSAATMSGIHAPSRYTSFLYSLFSESFFTISFTF